MEYRITVLTDFDMWGSEEEKVLICNEESKEHLENEMQGFNCSIWEYETEDKKIIDDLMIRSILKIEDLEIKETNKTIKMINKELDRIETELKKRRKEELE